MIPAYTLNRAYSIFFITFSVIGKFQSSPFKVVCILILDSLLIVLIFCRNLLFDELTDSHYLQPV